MRLLMLVVLSYFFLSSPSLASEDQSRLIVADSNYRIETWHLKSSYKTLCEGFQKCQLQQVGLINGPGSGPISIGAKVHIVGKGTFIHLINYEGILSGVPDKLNWQPVEIELLPTIFNWSTLLGSCVATLGSSQDKNSSKVNRINLLFESCDRVYAHSLSVSTEKYSDLLPIRSGAERLEHLVLCEVGVIDLPMRSALSIIYNENLISGALEAHCEEFITAYYKV